jgi:hypothetical protein
LRNEEVLQRVKEDRNIIHTAKLRKANWIGHIWRRELPSETGHLKKNRRKDGSNGKTKKKT